VHHKLTGPHFTWTLQETRSKFRIFHSHGQHIVKTAKKQQNHCQILSVRSERQLVCEIYLFDIIQIFIIKNKNFKPCTIFALNLNGLGLNYSSRVFSEFKKVVRRYLRHFRCGIHRASD
jgi:hypothetical protein